MLHEDGCSSPACVQNIVGVVVPNKFVYNIRRAATFPQRVVYFYELLTQFCDFNATLLNASVESILLHSLTGDSDM